MPAAQDPEEVRRWLRVELSGVGGGRPKGAEIHWGDEAGEAADRHRGVTPAGAAAGSRCPVAPSG